MMTLPVSPFGANMCIPYLHNSHPVSDQELLFVDKPRSQLMCFTLVLLHLIIANSS